MNAFELYTLYLYTCMYILGAAEWMGASESKAFKNKHKKSI